MEIFARSGGGKTLIREVEHADIDLESGDSVKISYKTPTGQIHAIHISAHHLILLAAHEGTDKALLCRPGSVSAVN